MKQRPAQRAERPNGRRRECGEAKAAEAAARRLRAYKTFFTEAQPDGV
jgi:hypothetical protein